MSTLNTSSSLQIKITEKLSELFNDSYKEYSGITDEVSEKFKFKSILDYSFNNYLQYDLEGHAILDSKGNPIKYVPVQVGEIMGDREANPDVFISDIIIPISMLVEFDDVEDTLETINLFNNKIVGQVYNIDYYNFGQTEKFKLTLLPNMPSFEDENTNQGDFYKNISFELIGVLSCGVAYGNQIKYSLSIDNQNWYSFTKIEPTTSRNKDLHIDQVINDDTTKSTEKTITWGKEMSIVAKTNDFLTKILLLNSECIRNDNFWLKTEIIGFNMSGYDDDNYNIDNDTLTIIKPIELSELSYSDDLGDFVSFNFSMVERY